MKMTTNGADATNCNHMTISLVRDTTDGSPLSAEESAIFKIENGGLIVDLSTSVYTSTQEFTIFVRA